MNTDDFILQVIEVKPSQNGGPGEVLGTIEFEAGQMTSVAFGGPNLTDLYVTSAKMGDPKTWGPQGGSFFVVKNLKSHEKGNPDVQGFTGRNVKLP